MTTRWMAGVARRLAPPPAGSDADLLARFAESRDPGAFAAIVARHGAAVYGVCRARLANAADADDAFQVVFYVLARDAQRIRDRESVAGWLMRVAQLTALKVKRHHARHPAAELPADVAERRPDDGAAREERAIVTEELAALPDKFRSVLVLCTVEGRSNTEAAEALGCPRGTVDSRLAAAKAKLRQRLLRRGIGLAAVASFEAVLPRLGAGHGGWPALADGSWLTAIQYGTGASHPTTLTLIADGVSTAMTTTTKLVATALLAGGLLATTGFGLTQIPGDGPPAPAAKAAPPAKPDAPPRPKNPDAKPAAEPLLGATPRLEETQVRRQLSRSCVKFQLATTLGELIVVMREEYGLNVRLDLAAYKRIGTPEFNDGGDSDYTEFAKIMYAKKLQFFTSYGVNVSDVLTETCAQLPGKNSFRVRDGQVLIGPAHRPAAMPNRVGESGEPGLIDPRVAAQQVLGEPISVALEDKPFKEAIRELRRITGANIVVDSRGAAGSEKVLLTATFDDVPLYSALEILGDMVDLKPVFLNNVFYLTSPTNAEKLQKKVNEELFGRERKPLAVPAGYLTDGINLYRNPGNLKPEMPNAGGVPGVEPAEPTPAVKK